MRVIFMGTPVFAVPCLNALVGAGHVVSAVVTQPDRPGGRGMALRSSAVKSAALDHGLEVLQPARLKDPAFLEAIGSLRPECIVVVAYGKILPPDILQIPEYGCVNVHASILPRYRGAAPINYAIIEGDTVTGVTTMLMDEGMDTGPVLLTEKVNIGYEDTAVDLAKKLSVAGASLLIETLAGLERGTVAPKPQDDGLATYAPTLRKEDGEIDWSKPAEAVRNLVRGVFPWPGAYTRWGGRFLKVHGGRASAEEAGEGGQEPGTVVRFSGDSIGVRCGEGVFEITELQPENRKRMKAADFIRGYRLGPGERFGG